MVRDYAAGRNAPARRSLNSGARPRPDPRRRRSAPFGEHRDGRRARELWHSSRFRALPPYACRPAPSRGCPAPPPPSPPHSLIRNSTYRSSSITFKETSSHSWRHSVRTVHYVSLSGAELTCVLCARLIYSPTESPAPHCSTQGAVTSLKSAVLMNPRGFRPLTR